MDGKGGRYRVTRKQKCCCHRHRCCVVKLFLLEDLRNQKFQLHGGMPKGPHAATKPDYTMKIVCSEPFSHSRDELGENDMANIGEKGCSEGGRSDVADASDCRSKISVCRESFGFWLDMKCIQYMELRYVRLRKGRQQGKIVISSPLAQ